MDGHVAVLLTMPLVDGSVGAYAEAGASDGSGVGAADGTRPERADGLLRQIFERVGLDVHPPQVDATK